MGGQGREGSVCLLPAPQPGSGDSAEGLRCPEKVSRGSRRLFPFDRRRGLRPRTGWASQASLLGSKPGQLSGTPVRAAQRVRERSPRSPELLTSRPGRLFLIAATQGLRPATAAGLPPRDLLGGTAGPASRETRTLHLPRRRRSLTGTRNPSSLRVDRAPPPSRPSPPGSGSRSAGCCRKAVRSLPGRRGFRPREQG